MKRYGLIATTLIVLAGCMQQEKSADRPVTGAWEAPQERTPAPAAHAQNQNSLSEAQASAAPAQSGEVIAMVNGAPIYRRQVTDMLIDAHGLQTLEHFIILKAAQLRAEQMGLTVTAEDIAAEHRDALNRLGTPIVDPHQQQLDPQAAEAVLRQILDSRNIARIEWDARMQRMAYIRKIAEAEVQAMEITDDMLRQEYNLNYGEKVQIRHIQVNSLATVRRVRALLDQKKDFELVARQMSENPLTASLGGLLPPFTRYDEAVSPLIREAAFELKEGQVSLTIPEGGVYHIIKLEKRFPSSNVKFAHVDRETLARQLKDRLVRQRMDELEAELFRSATVDVRQPTLAEQFRERHR